MSEDSNIVHKKTDLSSNVTLIWLLINVLLCGPLLLPLYEIDVLIWNALQAYFETLSGDYQTSVNWMTLFCYGLGVLSVFQMGVGVRCLAYWIRTLTNGTTENEGAATRSIIQVLLLIGFLLYLFLYVFKFVAGQGFGILR